MSIRLLVASPLLPVLGDGCGMPKSTLRGWGWGVGQGSQSQCPNFKLDGLEYLIKLGLHFFPSVEGKEQQIHPS